MRLLVWQLVLDSSCQSWTQTQHISLRTYLRRLQKIAFSLLKYVFLMEYQRSPLYGELSQGTRPTGRTQVRYKYYFIGGLKVLQTNIQIWENTSSEGLIKKIWGVVGFEGISNETRQKRKRTPKRRRQLYLLTLRKRLPLPFWTVQLRRTLMIHGRNNVPKGHTDSVSSNLLLTLFFGKMRLVCANGDSRASL